VSLDKEKEKRKTAWRLGKSTFPGFVEGQEGVKREKKVALYQIARVQCKKKGKRPPQQSSERSGERRAGKKE